MVQVTISLVLFDNECHVGAVIERILQLENTEFELYITDRESKDSTAEIVQSFRDNRIHFLASKRSKSRAQCHNLVLEKSRAPYFATINPHTMLHRDALRKLLDLLNEFPEAGMAQSYFYEMSKQRIESRERFQNRKETFSLMEESEISYRQQVLGSGSIRDGLRIYRTELLRKIGGFRKKKEPLSEYDLTLRIIDRAPVTILPEFIYFIQKHGDEKGTSREFWYRWLQRVVHTYRLRVTNQVSFLSQEDLNLSHRLFLPLKQKTWFRFRRFFRRKKRSYLDNLYHGSVRIFSWWPIGLHSRRVKQPKRIAYYIWHFPVLSQTFLRRELFHLWKSDIDVRVFADEPEMPLPEDPHTKSLVETTTYVHPIQAKLAKKYQKFFFRKNPFRYCNLYLFVLAHRFGKTKKFVVDKKLFHDAVYLAGIFKDHQIDHVHSPWANTNAVTALIASRLLGISFSVQARAHDLHRILFRFGLKEKFEHAAFVITNTRYNQKYIESRIWQNHNGSLHLIHNGIDLREFTPQEKQNKNSKTRILCVARLIEEKGLIYLLEACKILKERGIAFQCEIIGGVEPIYRTYFLAVKKLYHRFQLQDCVFFLGSLPFSEVMNFYSAADLFVLPCVIAEHGGHDITPNSLIEAMAMKLPVVSTPIGGIPEIVEDGVSGILVPPKNAQALAQEMIRLIENESLRQSLGAKARQRMEDRFDITKNAEKYALLFRGEN